MLHDIAEHARSLIYPTVTSVEQWAQMMASGRPEFEREAEAGSYALETLLEQQVDKAFDKFTAYALRNIFSVPDGVELVMVSCGGGGEATVVLRATKLSYALPAHSTLRLAHACDSSYVA